MSGFGSCASSATLGRRLSSMPEFDDIPLVDGHLHPPLLDPDVHPFVRFFTESDDAEILKHHSPNSVFFRRAISELASLFGCEPSTEGVQAARKQLGADGLMRLLVDGANWETLLVDDGYPRQGALTIDEMARGSGRVARRVLRLEALEEDLLVEADSAEHLAQLLLNQLEAQNDFVGLKSIVAYRSGLDVREPEPAQLAGEFQEARSQQAAGKVRLDSKALIDFCLLKSAGVGRRRWQACSVPHGIRRSRYRSQPRQSRAASPRAGVTATGIFADRPSSRLISIRPRGRLPRLCVPAGLCGLVRGEPDASALRVATGP